MDKGDGIMWIVSNDDSVILNSSFVEDFRVEKSDKLQAYCVLAYCTAGMRGVLMGKYDTKSQAQIALGRLFNALADCENDFIMPVQEEVEFARQHGEKCTSRKRGHGGS